MSKIDRLIIFLPLFMLGCAPNIIDENKVIQKIESLDMTIFSNSGEIKYTQLPVQIQVMTILN